MKPAADQSYCPRLSEAKHLLPLLRGYLVGAAPERIATPIDLVPIVEDGLFGYELIPDGDMHVYPIIGRNAQGEPVVHAHCAVGILSNEKVYVGHCLQEEVSLTLQVYVTDNGPLKAAQN